MTDSGPSMLQLYFADTSRNEVSLSVDWNTLNAPSVPNTVNCIILLIVIMPVYVRQLTLVNIFGDSSIGLATPL